MAGSKFIVRPIRRDQARALCEDHPHAGTLPNSSRYYMRLDIGGRAAGLAVWGYGVQPAMTPRHLFGDAGRVADYLELCRFFVYDWCPRNTASRFLAVTHRILRKHAPGVKWLYTYAAGFQGMIGHIYKAAGYDYIGTQECGAFTFVPDIGLVHWVSIWHRYGLSIGAGRHCPRTWEALRNLWPGCLEWYGLNFRYIYWLCDKADRRRLLDNATFEVQQYPTLDDLRIWTVGPQGERADVSVAFAKSVPIVKLKTKRAGSADSGTPTVQAGGGGATPTPALSTTEVANG